MINYRIIATSAAIAFILSLVSGVVGGVALLVLLVRAVIAAVIFAAVVAGLLLIVDRFLPELSVFFSADRATPSEVEPEREGIDIVVQEDELPEGLYTRNDETEDDQQLADEVGEYTEEDASDPPFTIRGTPETVAPPDFVDSMDSLPDLDAFADTFSSQDSADEGNSSGGSGTKSETSDGYDPATMAKAVQTLLKKDREGNGNYGR